MAVIASRARSREIPGRKRRPPEGGTPTRGRRAADQLPARAEPRAHHREGEKERRAKDSFDRDGLAIQHEPRASAVRQPVNGAALLRSGGIASTTALRIFCCGNLPTPVAVR